MPIKKNEVWIEYMALDDLATRRRDDNPKNHDLDLLDSLVKEVGFVDPPVIDERDGSLRAGHGRTDELLAMRARGDAPPERIKLVRGAWYVPVLRGVNFKTDRAAQNYMIGANRSVERGGWENMALARLLASYAPEDLASTGFTEDDRVAFMKLSTGDGGAAEGMTEPDAVPDLPRTAVTRQGDLWVLGDHRIVCGETRDAKVVARAAGGRLADINHADPPYGMGKEKDGIENDNLYDDKLDDFQDEWFRTWLGSAGATASVYVWGNAPDLWRWWWERVVVGMRQEKGPLCEEQLLIRNEIVWDKGSAFGMRSEGAHSYPPATERCLFLMRGQQFLGNQNKEDFWEGYEPLRSWMEAEVARAGWTGKDVNRITATHMSGHWTGKSQFMPINRENYDKLSAAAEGRAFTETYADLFGRLFPEVRKGGNAHRRDLTAQLREGRSYFDNTHDTMTDVWQFPRVVGEERFGHATPKPVAMVERALKSSCSEGGVVGVPFAGTGPEFIAAERLGRRAFGVEISPLYVDVVVERWQAYTGKKAKRSRS